MFLLRPDQPRGPESNQTRQQWKINRKCALETNIWVYKLVLNHNFVGAAQSFLGSEMKFNFGLVLNRSSVSFPSVLVKIKVERTHFLFMIRCCLGSLLWRQCGWCEHNRNRKWGLATYIRIYMLGHCGSVHQMKWIDTPFPRLLCCRTVSLPSPPYPFSLSLCWNAGLGRHFTWTSDFRE